MSNIPLNNMMDKLPDFMKEAINERLKVIVDERVTKAIEEIKKDVEDRREEIITGVVLKMERLLSFERYGQDLKITVKLEDGK